MGDGGSGSTPRPPDEALLAGRAQAELDWLARQPPARHRLVLSRLRAVVEWSADRRGGLEEREQRLSKAMGVAVPRAREIERAWSRAPTLRSLGAGSPGRRAGPLPVDGDRLRATDLMRRRLQDGFDGPSAELVAEARRALAPTEIGRSSFYRWLDDARRQVVAPQGFGAELRLVAPQLALRRPGGGSYRLAALIDAASGMIVGFDIGGPEELATRYRAAVADALSGRLSGLPLGGMPAAAAVERVSIDLSGDLGNVQLMLALVADLSAERLPTGEAEMEHERLLRLGDPPLLPPSAAASRTMRPRTDARPAGDEPPVGDARRRTVLDAEQPSLPREAALRIVASAVDAYNREIAERFAGAGAAGSPSDAARSAVAGRLRPAMPRRP